MCVCVCVCVNIPSGDNCVHRGRDRGEGKGGKAPQEWKGGQVERDDVIPRLYPYP